ncbi:MAG: hypothetical protein Q7R95_01925, partial [bacterium]|nr:hypothetical protein [bacterium]
MTLISATQHWKGTCFAADTRATNIDDGTHCDNYQKFYHVGGGIAMSISGDAFVGNELRKNIQYNLKKILSSNNKLRKLDSSEPVIREIIQQSLDDLPENDLLKNNNTEVISEGFISFQDIGMVLTLDSEECNNILNILCCTEGIQLNDYYPKHIDSICRCQRKEVDFIEISNCYQNFLFVYTFKYNPSTNEASSYIKRIKFGEIVAL